jgi:hypothetical protein
MSNESDDDLPFRGEIRLARLRRVSHGLGLVKKPDLSNDEEWRRDLRAYLLVLPPGAAFTHLTGARLLGWQLPRLPDQVPVFAAVTGSASRPRRHGLICSRLVERGEPVRRHGLPVERGEEILLRAARDLGLLDLLILLESALQLGHVDHDRMTALLASRRPGVRMLREAWRVATGKSHSAGETVLQAFHRAMDVPFRPQAEVHDGDGYLVAQADLHVLGTNYLHEYDGEHHRRRDQQRVDLRRDRGLTASSYVRKGFVLDDLLNHPVVVMHEIDNALGRPHDLGRLRRWRKLVENSLYSDAGRARIMNRWRRAGGLRDWSGSA